MTLDDAASEALERLVTAVLREQACEEGARNKDWDDHTAWDLYLQAREERRAAVRDFDALPKGELLVGVVRP